MLSSTRRSPSQVGGDSNVDVEVAQVHVDHHHVHHHHHFHGAQNVDGRWVENHRTWEGAGEISG